MVCCGVAKVLHRTRTRNTRFGNTAGIPVPVANPNAHMTCLNCLIELTFNLACILILANILIFLPHQILLS